MQLRPRRPVFRAEHVQRQPIIIETNTLQAELEGNHYLPANIFHKHRIRHKIIIRDNHKLWVIRDNHKLWVIRDNHKLWVIRDNHKLRVIRDNHKLRVIQDNHKLQTRNKAGTRREVADNQTRRKR